MLFDCFYNDLRQPGTCFDTKVLQFDAEQQPLPDCFKDFGKSWNGYSGKLRREMLPGIEIALLN